MPIGTIIVPQNPPVGTFIRPAQVTPEPTDDTVGTSMLGTPVYSNLIFLADPDTPENRDLRMDTILMYVSQFRNIIVTPVAGRNGTVKEYISDNDYDIEVRGLIVSEHPNVFPREEVEALKNICKLKKAVQVAGNFLEIFDISYAVITAYDIGEKLGSRNEVPFTLRMLSDDPIEIKVNAGA